jgi:2-oxoglutarate-Fe(II)-dependent oxygenase superfamily protein
MLLSDYLNPIDQEALRAQVRASKYFPNFCVDNFLQDKFIREVVDSYPSYSESLQRGQTFRAVNERGKVQISDSKTFAAPIAKLNEVLASPEFLALLSYVMDIPDLIADPELVGGGIHQTGPRGRLDVHVDFNYIEARDLYRRLNILLYLNEGWQEEWGGDIELWDPEVKICHQRLSPIFNRCVVFETNEISYHGVTAVNCPAGIARRSFAAYYYTKVAPPHWNGQSHSTIFRSRPNEVLKGAVLMPAEKAQDWVRGRIAGALCRAKRVFFGAKTP